MSIELPLESMTLADKLEAMEASWPDISRRPADLPSPDWHKDNLNERWGLVAEGKLKFVDWDTTPMKPMSCTPATHRLFCLSPPFLDHQQPIHIHNPVTTLTNAALSVGQADTKSL